METPSIIARSLNKVGPILTAVAISACGGGNQCEKPVLDPTLQLDQPGATEKLNIARNPQCKPENDPKWQYLMQFTHIIKENLKGVLDQQIPPTSPYRESWHIYDTEQCPPVVIYRKIPGQQDTKPQTIVYCTDPKVEDKEKLFLSGMPDSTRSGGKFFGVITECKQALIAQVPPNAPLYDSLQNLTSLGERPPITEDDEVDCILKEKHLFFVRPHYQSDSPNATITKTMECTDGRIIVQSESCPGNPIIQNISGIPTLMACTEPFEVQKEIYKK